MRLFKPALLLFTLTVLAACNRYDDPVVAFEKGEYETAMQLWLPRARAGDAEAQNYLGIHYTLGLGVQRDYKEAIRWLEPAARSGHPDAQRNYGLMHLYGKGLPQNYYQAYIWFFAASQQGHDKARIQMDILAADKLSPNQQMHAKLDANEFIPDPAKRFMSHDTYIDKR